MISFREMVEVDEAFSNWRKAYGAHDVEERAADNKLWKHRKAIAAAGSTLAGDIPGAIYHGSKYVVQRGIKTAVNRVKEIANERRKRTTKAT